MRELNMYGDRADRPLGEFGHDISSQRVDDLDRACFKFALGLSNSAARGIDLGCGLGSPSIVLALIGVRMLLVDRLDFRQRFEALEEQLATGNLTFLCKDAALLEHSDLPDECHFIYTRRFLHFLRYGQACDLISLLKDHMVTGGRVFISVSGLNSELGYGYSDAQQPVEKRFGRLSQQMREHHNIAGELCLYTEAELSELFTQNGFEPVDTWASEFRNVQGVVQKA